MGQNESSSGGVHITEKAHMKLAAKAMPPDCSEPLECELEKQDIEGLKKMVEMDEANTKKMDLTTEKFYEYYNSVKQMSSVLDILDVPVFEDEREEIMKSFENDEEKEEGEEEGQGEGDKDGKDVGEKVEEGEKEEEEGGEKEKDKGSYERREKALNNYSEAVKEALDKIVRKSRSQQDEDVKSGKK